MFKTCSALLPVLPRPPFAFSIPALLFTRYPYPTLLVPILRLLVVGCRLPPNLCDHYPLPTVSR